MPSSNTPQYDALVEPILAELKPGKRICKVTGNEFEIVQQEIDLLRKMKLPPPTTCPRFRRTLLNGSINYCVLYNRKSDKSGKTIISEFSPNSPYKIWDHDEWWSDDWSALEYGRDYDALRSFFNQFHALDLAVPRSALFRDSSNVNSDYVLGGAQMKDCYMVFGGTSNEDVLYSESAFGSHACTDTTRTDACENCYEVIGCKSCYNCQYSIESADCVDGRFLFDCRGCTNCFLCTNLRNKSYCFENKQLSEGEYKKRILEINLGNRTERDTCWREFYEMLGQASWRAVRVVSSEDCVGDDLENCKQCYQGFVIRKAENTMYTIGSTDAKDVLSSTVKRGELVYMGMRVYDSYGVYLSSRVRHCRNVEYSTECYQCENCFGCVGLRNKKFCILNKQYSEDEYWKLVDQIKVDMMKQGEYGEFFPLSLAPFPYQDTFAGVWPGYHALFTEEAKKHGAWITDEDLDKPNDEALPAKDFPEDIKDVQDDIIEKILLSESGEKMFRIIPREVRFYRDFNIPLPTLNFAERRDKRYKFLRPLKLFTHQCAACKKEASASLDPQTPGHVLCTECYLKTIY